MTSAHIDPHQIFSLFLFGTLVFNDFNLTSYCINLTAKYPITQDVVEFLLDQLSEITKMEFFLIYKKDKKDSVDLYCLSDPSFFAKLNQIQ